MGLSGMIKRETCSGKNRKMTWNLPDLVGLFKKTDPLLCQVKTHFPFLLVMVNASNPLVKVDFGDWMPLLKALIKAATID